MKVVNNMQLLAGSSDNKKTTGSFSLKFNAQKVKLEMLALSALKGNLREKNGGRGMQNLKVDKHFFQTKQAARKDRTGEEEMWQLSRFYPMIEVSYYVTQASPFYVA
jgi:syntaxin-binding protein 1